MDDSQVYNVNLDHSPIFIIGNPRSGTSLLRRIINAHSSVVIPPECGFAQWLFKEYSDWTLSSNKEEKVNQFIFDLSRCRKIETWELDFQRLSIEIIKKEPANYSKLIDLVYRSYGQSQNQSQSIERWGDKNNYYINHIPLMIQLFPNAQFVLIIRDGRDVSCSYKELAKKKLRGVYKPVLPTDISEIAREWLSNNENSLNVLSGLEEKQFYTVRYEDLVTEADSAVKSICKFLNLDFERMMLNHYSSRKALEPKMFLKWKERLVQPIDQQSVGRYLKDLTPSEIDDFNKIAKSLLKKFGYLI